MRVSQYINITAVFLLCQLFFVESAVEKCSADAEYSISGMMLRRHIFEKITGAPLGSVCLRECYRDVRCQSFNYVISQSTCELSNRTKEARPEDFVPSSARYYFKRVMNRVRLGTISEMPAESCQEIKASEGEYAVDGKYWLNFFDIGKTVLAYCDMKTGDIDECSASVRVCDVNAICQNTLGSYHCSRKAGYSGDGKTCTDIDECSASVRVCDANAICQNTLSSYLCSCKAGYSGDRKTCTAANKDCAELHKAGIRNSDVYRINPDGLGAFDVFCDQTTDGGGWTVFQKRMNASVDFYRVWADYKRGFGNLNGEFWLGLDKIHRLTSSGGYKLRVDLEDFAGNTVYAEYGLFTVGSEGTKYQLNVGSYSGTAGDSLAFHNGYPFSTKDQDNDSRVAANCAVSYKGAWWYSDCYHSNLNGIYHHGKYTGNDGVNWHKWTRDSAKRAQMKIRPVNY